MNSNEPCEPPALSDKTERDFANAAIYYHPEGYDTSQQKLMGRHAAGEGFLKAFSQHHQQLPLYCYAARQVHAEHFSQKVNGWYAERPTEQTDGQSKAKLPVRWIPFHQPQQLQAPGCLFLPGPGLTRHAWERRHADQAAYSLCGITHTTSSHGVMDAVGDWLLAPIQPWDAVICTTQSVKTMLQGMLGHWGEYLGQRFGGVNPVSPSLQLPVIPLGVEAHLFRATDTWQAQRQKLRYRYRIAADDVAFLFVGRLSYHAKAHPYPMFVGLEQAARRFQQSYPDRHVHLLMVGWFANEALEKQFKTAAEKLCPHVTVQFIDGRPAETRQYIWAAADVFTSLSDNIQETFGLTPIEAMAAGLPVVVSDWDGYRETVRHGVEGFTIPTALPAPGCGEDLALRHATEIDSYDRYIGYASQMTVVDIPATTEAYYTLLSQPALRQQMGAAGRQRAATVFDWPVIIRQYEALWQSLGDCRQSQGVSHLVAARQAHQPANPLRDDPFRLFAHYPTVTIDAHTPIRLSTGLTLNTLRLATETEMNTLAARLLLSPEHWQRLLTTLTRQSPQTLTVAMLAETMPEQPWPGLVRTLGWMAKLGLVELEPLDSLRQWDPADTALSASTSEALAVPSCFP
ncbi:MAG: glycosyltransferase family 4 protein [Candidatus Melainabacteria bacterium]|nr:glycosyltransferase family 4 protein [Candidatus Melainabacteria bacterium]